MLTPMRWRAPDKPIRITQEQLPDIDLLGGFIATIKKDGWRSTIDWTGSELEFYSRRGMDKGGPTILPVCDELRKEVHQFFINNNIPPNTRLDGEWIGRRSEGPEELVIFGIPHYNGDWIGSESERVRWELVKSFRFEQGNFMLAEYSEENYSGFFTRMMKRDLILPENLWTAEGIVLKQEDSKLIGNLNHSDVNGGWFKAKWRDSADGRNLNTF